MPDGPAAKRFDNERAKPAKRLVHTDQLAVHALAYAQHWKVT